MNGDLVSLPADLRAHIQLLRSLPHQSQPVVQSLFQRDAPILVARAPGRLDVMGGIADYLMIGTRDSRVNYHWKYQAPNS